MDAPIFDTIKQSAAQPLRQHQNDDGEFWPAMWHDALDDDEATDYTLKAIARSHGLKASVEHQEQPEDLFEADVSDILAAVSPPSPADVFKEPDGWILVARWSVEDGIANWFVKPADSTNHHIATHPTGEVEA